MPLGRIARFFEDRGYGFIKPDAGGPNVFFNMKEVTRLPSGSTAREEARVEFDIVHVDGRLRAENVRLV
jgi:cold shock CspA family protein